MEDLIKRLQDEAGLTEDQAVKSIGVIKDFMDKEGLKIDWNSFFKGNDDLSDKAKALYNNMTKQTQSYTEKIVDKVDELASKAKKGAHDISQKAADFFDEK